MTPAPVTKSLTVGAAPKAAKKFKRVTAEDLERLVVKIGRQLGNDRLDVESRVACLQHFQRVGPKQIGPILDTIFEARRKFFLAKFTKFGVPAEVAAKWDSQTVGKPSGKVFAEAGELIAKAKAKLPICRCGRHERTYVRDGELYDTCWECAKERKDDRRDAQRVPARLAAPSAKQHLMTMAMLGGAATLTQDVRGLKFEIREAGQKLDFSRVNIHLEAARRGFGSRPAYQKNKVSRSFKGKKALKVVEPAVGYHFEEVPTAPCNHNGKTDKRRALRRKLAEKHAMSQ